MDFSQPDAYSCVPITFAYLAYKQCNLDYQTLRRKLLETCSASFNLSQDGMSFTELKTIVERLGFLVSVTSSHPAQKMYLAGVERLPREKQHITASIIEAQQVGSILVTETEFIYPEGHAIAVFEHKDTTVIFDSFLGEERALSFDVVLDSLEQQPEFLTINSYRAD